VAVQHLQLRISRQGVLNAKCVQRLGHEVWTDQPTGGQNDDRGVWEPQSFSRHRRTKVHLVTDDDIGAPAVTDIEQPGGSFACDPPSDVPDHPLFVTSVNRHQRAPQ
jgi:hypothetical protein